MTIAVKIVFFIALSVLGGSSLLRALVSINPRLDKSWDFGSFHTEVNGLCCLGVWLSLSTLCCLLLFLMIRRSNRSLTWDFSYQKVLLALWVLAYTIWLPRFIYTQFQVANFPPIFQLVYTAPCLTNFCHTVYQIYFIFTCPRERQSPQLRPSLLAIFSIFFNLIMVLHLCTIAVVTTLKSKGLDLDVFCLFGFELVSRLYAIFVFYRLYHVQSEENPPQEQEQDWCTPDEETVCKDTAYWEYSCDETVHHQQPERRMRGLVVPDLMINQAVLCMCQ